MTSSVERVASLTIGTVESVSPDEIHVILDIDAPQTVALNTGVPAAFPRVNAYVLIPNESGAVVGLVVFLGVERSPFPRRTGLKDFGLVDLPFPLRKLHVTPVGTLRIRPLDPDEPSSDIYELERGVAAFPTVGDAVLLPTDEQLRAIIESGGSDRRVRIGTSPFAANASITVDPNKLFGRHLAILGNTGSGKSCSVAGIIRWSLEAATAAATDERAPNARFVILDPNAEYLKTFSDLKPRIFSVLPGDSAEPLRVPAWMWNSLEWTAFAQASPRVQRPLLLEALRLARSGGSFADTFERRLGRAFAGRFAHVQSLLKGGTDSYSGWQALNSLRHFIDRLVDDTVKYGKEAPAEWKNDLTEIWKAASKLVTDRGYTSKGKVGFNELAEGDLEAVAQPLEALVKKLPKATLETTQSEDNPARFDLSTFPDFLKSVGSVEVSGNEQFTENLIWRVRSLLTDGRLREVIGDSDVSLEKWLAGLLGADASTSHISIIDLSLVPTEIIHIVIAVVTRLIFEAVQRYRRHHGVELPTVLVLEEAHTFVRRARMRDDDEGDVLSAAQMCRMTFERVAREGRKFGLGLLLSSQRPYELSATVLAQCNTFLLHRLVNDQDQELVRLLVPDNVRGILRELPSLPAGQAILLGWAAAVPVLVQMSFLPRQHRPHSSDPEYWRVWTREQERPVSWQDVIAK